MVSGYQYNEKAEECALIGWSLYETMTCNDIQSPLLAVGNKFLDYNPHLRNIKDPFGLY